MSLQQVTASVVHDCVDLLIRNEYSEAVGAKKGCFDSCCQRISCAGRNVNLFRRVRLAQLRVRKPAMLQPAMSLSITLLP